MTWTRVGLSQTKNGLSSFSALSMNFDGMIEDVLVDGLHVVFDAGIGCGGSGLSSMIFCLPILPQRGCSVGSSMSVAKRMQHVARADDLSFSSCG